MLKKKKKSEIKGGMGQGSATKVTNLRSVELCLVFTQS